VAKKRDARLIKAVEKKGKTALQVIAVVKANIRDNNLEARGLPKRLTRPDGQVYADAVCNKPILEISCGVHFLRL
jgi:hypothetical protein